MELNFSVGDLIEAKWYKTFYEATISEVLENKPGWYVVEFVEDGIKKTTNKVRHKTYTNCPPSGVQVSLTKNSPFSGTSVDSVVSHTKNGPVSGTSVDSVVSHTKNGPVSGTSVDSVVSHTKNGPVSGTSASVDSVVSHTKNGPVSGTSVDSVVSHTQNGPVSGTSVDSVVSHTKNGPVSGTSVDSVDSPKKNNSVHGTSDDSVHSPTKDSPVSRTSVDSVVSHSNIFTVTIGHALPIVFRNKVTQEDSTLEPAEGSLYAMSMESQHHWSHRIDMADLIDASRYSITFRSVGKNYKNSTIIIGDSNTKHLKFSTGQHREMGTFGYNMPGERVETFHISQIDERKCLGYRNIVIHCGINDIRDNSPGRQMSDPQPTEVKEHFNNLIQKIENIKNMCPNSSIVVNPLLPTKSQNLNQRVLKFNSLLFEFLANDIRGEGVRSTNFTEFVDHEHGVLKEEYGVWDTKSNNYSKRDILHMGKLGIRLLARIIRDSVYTKLVTSRSYSSTLTHQSRSQGGLSR